MDRISVITQNTITQNEKPKYKTNNYSLYLQSKVLKEEEKKTNWEKDIQRKWKDKHVPEVKIRKGRNWEAGGERGHRMPIF